MKIAINRCFGGFGISHDAVMRYAELSGITLYPLVEKRGKNGELLCDGSFEPYKNQKNTCLIHYLTEPLNDDGSYVEGSYWSDGNIDRNDPILIKVIEEMGSAASDKYAAIEIVEIPDDVDWQIDDYDGQETVHEVHRSW